MMVLGPNSALSSGSQIALLESQVAYAVEVAQKLQHERLKSIEVKSARVLDYEKYIEVCNVTHSSSGIWLMSYSITFPRCERAAFSWIDRFKSL